MNNFDVGYPTVQSLDVVLKKSNEDGLILKQMERKQWASNELLNILLKLKGSKYCLDGVLVSEEQAIVDLLALKKQYNIDCVSDEKFISMCKTVYGRFVYGLKETESEKEIPKKKNGKIRLNGMSRSMAGFFLSEGGDLNLNCLIKVKSKTKENPNEPVLGGEEGQSALMEEQALYAKVFRDSKLFPVVLKDVISNFKFDVAREVLNQLTSFEAKQFEYEMGRKNWSNILKEKNGELAHLQEISDLLMDIRKKTKDGSKFKNKNFNRLLNALKGRIKRDKNGKAREDAEGNYERSQGLISFMSENYPDGFQFKEDATERVFGYGSDVINVLLSHKSTLQYIVQKQYSDLVKKNFSWKKESVNIMSISKQKKVGLRLGDNFTHYSFEKINNQWHICIQNLIPGKNEENGEKRQPHKIAIQHTCYLNADTKLEEIQVNNDGDEESGEKKDKGYAYEYSRDSKMATHYSGIIKEPSIVYDKEKRVFRVILAVSKHKEVGLEVDEADLRKARLYFMNSGSFKGKKKTKSIGELNWTEFNAMGVDFGWVHPYCATVATVKSENEILSVVREIDKVCSKDSVDIERRKLDIMSVQSKINLAAIFVKMTRDWYTNQFNSKKTEFLEIKDKYSIAKDYIDWQKESGISKDQFVDFLEKNKKSTLTESLRQVKKNREWEVCRLISEIQQKFNKIRSEFFNCPTNQKSQYEKENNRVDLSTFLKKEMIRSFISLKRSFSTLGTTHESNGYFMENDFAKKDYAWLEGISRHCDSMMSDIVNIARKTKSKVIFIEDLDCHPSSYDDATENNKLKALWAFGNLQKALENKAKKHGIIVIGVDPEYTSLVDYETGLLGHRSQREDLHVFDEGKHYVRHCDFNASRNILYRGIKRHTDMRCFPVDKIDEKTYCISESMIGKNRKSAALYDKIGMTNCVFKRNQDGVFQDGSFSVEAVSKAFLKKRDEKKEEEKSKKEKVKKTYMFLHKNTWMLLHEIKMENEGKFKELYEGKTSLKDKSGRDREPTSLIQAN